MVRVSTLTSALFSLLMLILMLFLFFWFPRAFGGEPEPPKNIAVKRITGYTLSIIPLSGAFIDGFGLWPDNTSKLLSGTEFDLRDKDISAAKADLARREEFEAIRHGGNAGRPR